MNERKATKRALLTSITALVMCVVMLVGTTFAWFTDTATANVNKIQAGKLDVDIVDASGSSLEGQTLYFRDKNNRTNILWEPGATFNLDTFKIVNKGNLAIKYEIKITGTQGDAKLLEAIDFYVNDTTGALTSDSIGTGILMPAGETGSTSSAITIKGHMKESAKNEYQGLSLDGIAITVYATQAIYEYDSSSNTYDNGAFAALADLYPVSKSVAIAKDASGNKQQAVINDADALGKKTYEVTVPGAAMADDADNISVTVSKAASVDTANFSVDTTGNKLEQFDVTVSGIKSGNTTPITVELFIGKGYTTLTGNVPVKHLKASGVEDLIGTYNASNGCVTFKTTSFSPFAVEVPDMAAAIGAGHELTYYYTLAEAVTAVPTDGTETTITLLNNAEVENYIAIKDGKNIVLDLNGHDVVHNGNYLFDVYNAKFHVTGEGTLFENVKDGYAPIIARGSATNTADYTVITIDKNVTLKGDYTGVFVDKDAGNRYHNYGLVINMFGTIDMGAVTGGCHYSGMYVNGSNTVSDGNVMTINLGGATIKNCAATGIYAAGYAKWNITNSSITSGNTGIEIRAGELTVNGATVVGNGVPTGVTPNGNGATTDGAGIAVAQHTTKLPIKVTINGGDISGYSALYQSNPQKNDAESVKKVSVAVNGGMFKAINGGANAIYSENCTNFVTGGTFGSDPSNYLAEGYEATESSGVWTVAKS